MNYQDKRRQHILDGRPLPEKKKYHLPKVSPHRQAKLDAQREERGEGPTIKQKWFQERQKQLTGQCLRCGERYNHNVLKNAICATAHVLPKRKDMFPSVATHPENFIELGAACGCHHWYDNQATWEEIASSKIWPVVLEKFLLFEKFIKEREKIPEVFLQEIKPN